MAKENSIFDKIIRKEIPANIVYEDQDIMAFDDLNPQAPVHVLVVPKKKVKGFANLADADTMDVGRFTKGIALVAKKLDLNEDGYRVVFNYGRNGLQSVDYIHAHILGGRTMAWPPG